VNKYLFAAYTATWIIHIGYIISLSSRAAKLRRDWDEWRRNAK
jgi:CcmD family protein